MPRNRRHRLLIAREIGVEGRGGQQCALIGADRLGDVLYDRRLRFPRECSREQWGVARDARQTIDDRFLVRLTGCDRGGRRLRNLILEAIPVTTPVNDVQCSSIQHCRGIARVRTLLHTDGFRASVSSVKRRLMTARTAHISVDGQSRIEK